MLLGSGRLEVTHWVRSERLRPQIAMLVVQGLITARTVEILIFLRCRQRRPQAVKDRTITQLA